MGRSWGRRVAGHHRYRTVVPGRRVGGLGGGFQIIGKDAAVGAHVFIPFFHENEVAFHDHVCGGGGDWEGCVGREAKVMDEEGGRGGGLNSMG